MMEVSGVLRSWARKTTRSFFRCSLSTASYSRRFSVIFRVLSFSEMGLSSGSNVTGASELLKIVSISVPILLRYLVTFDMAR